MPDWLSQSTDRTPDRALPRFVPSASRMAQIQDPIIPIVGELIRQHPGTISLGQGVVNYPPPPQALEQVAQQFASPAMHLYNAVEGLPELRSAIGQKLAVDNHIHLSDSQAVVVTAGSNMAFMNTVLAITQPGDEIILLTPYYFNHEMAIGMAGCQAVLVPTDGNYQPRVDWIRAAITDRTRAIVTISPNNPTGAVYSRETLQAINQLCRDYQIYHISDEAYDYFTYGVEHVSPASLENSVDHTISLFSLSKAYGFAGWRIGYMVIPTALLPAVRKIQDTILICPPLASQYAAIGALQVGRSYCETQFKAIQQTREIVLNELAKISHFCTVPPAEGAFYFFLRLATDLDAMAIVEKLVQQFGVAAIPGNTFGITEGCYLRVAYGALAPETAAEGIGRLVKGLAAIVESEG